MSRKTAAVGCGLAASFWGSIIAGAANDASGPNQAPNRAPSQPPALVNPLNPADVSPPGLLPTPSASPSDAPSLASSQPAAADAAETDLLGPVYMNHLAGIILRPPEGCVLLGRPDASHLAQWADDKRKWTLKLSEIKLPEPHPLQTYVARDGVTKVPGLLDVTASNLQKQFPGGLLLRQDVTSFAGGRVVSPDANVDPRLKGLVVTNPLLKNNVGLVAFRYTSETQRQLTQQAIFQANEQLYYVLTFTTLGSNATSTTAPEDPGERLAANSFHQVVDSVQLLDRARIRKDQEERLFRTRSLYVNLDANGEKLRNSVVEEQWFRILQNGKDIGYTYITEDRARSIPRLDEDTTRRLREGRLTDAEKSQEMLKPKIDKGDGVLIGVRSRITTVGVRSDKSTGPLQTDSQSWFFVTPARLHEDWSKLIEVDDFLPKKKGQPKKLYTQEFGSSDRHMVNVKHEGATLSVSQVTNQTNSEPINRDLPPYYLPQALGHLLPRILPLKEPKTYLFVSFMSEAHELMFRYIDVGAPTQVTLAGQKFDAIPVSDRVGLEGSLTVHYVSVVPDSDGRYRYLGNENKDTHVAVVATDAKWLMQKWQDLNLNRPDAVDHPAPVAIPDRVLDVPRLSNPPDPSVRGLPARN